MARRARTVQDFPSLLLIHPASAPEGERFFAERFPEAAAAADPDHELYSDFGLTKGTLGQVAGPSVWFPTIKSLLSGNGAGRPAGDPLVLAGQFVAKDDALLYAHRTTHAAEEGDWDTLIRVAREHTSA